MPDTRATPDPRRVALYVRVSTTRQAEGELSISDRVSVGMPESGRAETHSTRALS